MNGSETFVAILVAVVIATLLVVIGYQGWLIDANRKQFAVTEGKLLDRIMARNYETLVQGDIVREQVKKTLTDDEIYEMQQERGIPV